jgi:LmbE family N-acetylglucosaminyl deacetylase
MLDALFLSPHLDDATLSAGGHIWQLAQSGKQVLVVTIMAGNPPTEGLSEFAQQLHRRWQLPAHQVAASRRAEDIAACSRLCCRFEHWHYLDAIYRLDNQGDFLYPTWPDVIGPLHPADDRLIDDLLRQLSQLPAFDQLYAPLAVGNHVDHQLVRRVAEKMRPHAAIYYEDFPYALQPLALAQAIPDETLWSADVVPLSQTALLAKFDAISAYVSQLSSWFKDRADLEHIVGQFTQKQGGERFWRQHDSI